MHVNNQQDEIKETIRNKFWNVYDSNTSNFSNILRQVAFAIGGICWFFKTSETLPQNFKIILLYVILFFVFDALQYLSASIIYALVGKYLELKNSKRLIHNKNEIQRKDWMNFLSDIFFIGKTCMLGIAAYLLIKFLL